MVTSAFTTIKEALANNSLLFQPKGRYTVSIAADAADLAVGVVLEQQIDGDWQPIVYFSKKLIPS